MIKIEIEYNQASNRKQGRTDVITLCLYNNMYLKI